MSLVILFTFNLDWFKCNQTKTYKPQRPIIKLGHDLPEEPEGFDAVADAVADGAVAAEEPAE